MMIAGQSKHSEWIKMCTLQTMTRNFLYIEFYNVYILCTDIFVFI